MGNPLENTAVLFIDIINDFNFERGERLIHHTREILPHLQTLKKFAKDHDIPTIYVNDHYGMWKTDFRTLITHCKNEQNQDILEAMKPDDNDYFLIKPKHSAFFQTPLQSLLHELGINRLILAGVAGDICILFTAKDAYMYEYSLEIPENCTASNEKQGNEYALYLMRSVMNANTEPI